MRSLAWKIALPIVLIIWIFFGLAGMMASRTRKAMIRGIVEEQVRAQLTIIERAIALFMETRTEPEHARTFIRSVFQQLSWQELEVRSPDGTRRVTLRRTPAIAVQHPVRVQKSFSGSPVCAECHETNTTPGRVWISGTLALDPYIRPVHQHYIRTMGVHFMASILLSLVIAVSMYIWVQRPLRRLVAAMDRVARGDLNVTLPIRGRDEIAMIQRHFVRMIHDLRAYYARREEEQWFRLQRATHLASVGEMAAMLAHEIKNPLAGVLSALEVLQERGAFSDEARDIIQYIGQDLARINRVIEDLLAYARPRPTQRETVDLTAVIEATVTRAAPLVAERGLTVETRIAPDVPPVEGDAEQLQQMLYNLMINAMDATEPGGRIVVALHHCPEIRTVQLTVEDTGCGIPPEQIDQIFRPFYSTKPKGTGLGLPVVLQIVENHGGHIQVDSEVGRGTRFTITLPAHHAGGHAHAETQNV